MRQRTSPSALINKCRYDAHHIKVLVLEEVVDLEQVLWFQAVRFAALQEQLNVLPLKQQTGTAVNSPQHSNHHVTIPHHTLHNQSHTKKPITILNNTIRL